MAEQVQDNKSTLTAEEFPVFDATIRWCLSFDKRISMLQVSEATPCTLLGTIEWHNLSQILRADINETEGHPGVAALEEKLVLLQDGIPCTLQQLEQGDVKARLSLEFSRPHSEQRLFRDSNWENIDKLPIVAMVRTLQGDIAAGKESDTTVVSLTCMRAQPGYFRQRSMKYKAALALARGVGVDAIPQSVANHYVAKDIINKKQYLTYGTRTRFSLHSGTDNLVGQHITHLG